jgi:hypothetical protein
LRIRDDRSQHSGSCIDIARPAATAAATPQTGTSAAAAKMS